jgi:hypothetical protein
VKAIDESREAERAGFDGIGVGAPVLPGGTGVVDGCGCGCGCVGVAPSLPHRKHRYSS